MRVIPSICLTGVDTTYTEGQIRVIVAVVSNGSYEIELHLKNITPEGTTRYANTQRVLEVGASSVGINVPLTEAGEHIISASLRARYSEGSEMVSVFEMAPTPVTVPQNYKGLELDSATLAIEDGSILVHAAVKRTSLHAPRSVTMIVRDQTLGLAALVKKDLDETEMTVIGLKAELTPGVHHFSTTLAVDVEGELTEVIAVNPTRV